MDKDRTIFSYKGANNHLHPDEVGLGDFDSVDFFHFTSMLDDSLMAQEKLAGYIRESGKTLLFNPASYLVKKGGRVIKPILESSRFLILNREEAQILLNQEVEEKPSNRQTMEYLEGLSGMGPEGVVITDGKQDFWGYDGRDFYRGKPIITGEEDVTGAGDGFSTGFLAGWMRTNDFRKALSTAQANAYSVVKSMGSFTSLTGIGEALRIHESQAQNYGIEKISGVG
mgnify:CR=1 FL=1